MHLPALFHPFFLDDYVYVYQAHGMSWRSIPSLFTAGTMDQSASGAWWVPSGTLPFYRPIGQLSFVADFLLWGVRSFGYHLTNVMLHLACTLLVWCLARRLFKAAGHALVATIAFALHPVHGEAVTWISGRFDLLVCAGVLASTLCYLKWMDDSVNGRQWLAMSVLWFAFGLGCKETALILPIVLLGIEVLREPDLATRKPRLVAAMAAFGIVSLLYLAARVALFGSIFGRLPPPYGIDMSSPLTAVQTIGWNAALSLFDLVLCIRIEPVYLAQFWRDHPLLFGATLAVSLVLFVTAVIKGRSRIMGIALIWLAMFTAPSLLSMPGERNIYLASVGLAIMIGAVFRAWDVRHPERSPSANLRLPGSIYIIAGLCLVVGMIGQTLMGFVANAGEKVYRDLQDMIPNPPQDARIYVFHQNPINSVGFTQAIRLRYGRSDLSGCALSLSPSLYASSERIVVTGPDSIRLVRDGGLFFASFIERFHRFSEPASTLAASGRRLGLDLLDPPTDYEHINELNFRMPYTLADPRMVILSWDNHRINRWWNLLDLTGRTELNRWRPQIDQTP
jgi:hypothetical protein